MYLLEAKKRAEKEYKKQQEKEKKEARERVKREAKERAKAAKANKAQVKKSSRSSGGGAAEAQRALEEAQMQEAIRRSQAEAAAKQREKEQREREAERKRQEDIRKTRQALQESDYDYEDSSNFNVKIGQTSYPKADMHFQVVQSHDAHEHGKKAQRRKSLGSDTWNDMSISCYYVGTFEVGKGANLDKAEVKRGINVMKDYIKNQRTATLIVCLEGLKVIDTTSSKVAMAHALSRVSMAAADAQLPLFGFVAKNPGVSDKFCHVFNMNTKANAERLQGLVMKAFRLAFANEKQAQLERKQAAAKKTGAPQPPETARPMGNRQWAKHNPLPGRQNAPVRPQPSARPKAIPGHAPPVARNQSVPATKVSAAAAAAGASVVVPHSNSAPVAPANSDGYALPQDASRVTPAAQSATSGDVTSIEDAAWFQAGIPREIAMELLEMSDDGAFVVRDSSSQPGNYALTMKGDGLMHHFIVRKVPEGYVLGSIDQGQHPFSDLGTLIVHYASTPGCLPCCLSLDSFNKVYNENEHDTATTEDAKEHSFVDPDYQDLVQLMGNM